ncbi:MAG: hypothetical protein ABSE62_17120, partial [Chthoniobacteraceae bacterium]
MKEAVGSIPARSTKRFNPGSLNRLTGSIPGRISAREAQSAVSLRPVFLAAALFFQPPTPD